MNRWTEADSRDLDAQIKATRHAERRERPMPSALKPRPAPRPWPKPRHNPSGTWTAAVRHKGQSHHRTFDTRAEAQAFIRKVKES